LGNEASGGSQAGVRQLTNIMRRVYRIFAHAWFQHRQVFWQVENNEGLYMLFKTVCDVYSLIPEENYTIPPEAEGLAAKEEEEEEQEGGAPKKKQGGEETVRADDDATTTTSTGATTRRHKSTPSFSSSVAAIAEGDEEDGKADSPIKDQADDHTDTFSDPKTQEVHPTSVSKIAEQTEEDQVSEEEKPIEQPASEPSEITTAKEETGDETPKDDEEKEKHEPTVVEDAESASGNTDPVAEIETEKDAAE